MASKLDLCILDLRISSDSFHSYEDWSCEELQT
jgi:hypothetical protein